MLSVGAAGSISSPVRIEARECSRLIYWVAIGKTPVASIVIQPCWNERCVIRLIERVRCSQNLKLYVIKNDWNVEVMYMTAMPEKTLAALLTERGDDIAGLKLHPKDTASLGMPPRRDTFLLLV